MLDAIQHALGTAVVRTCRWSQLNLEVFLLDMFVSSYADSWLLICKDFFLLPPHNLVACEEVLWN
jgi:hypothetical protein